MKITVQLSIDDLAWVSRKLNAHYVMVKNSDVFTEKEKNCEIAILVQRALAFRLYELVDRFGYIRQVIPLGDQREAEFIYPKGVTLKDISIARTAIDLHFNAKYSELKIA